MTRTGRMMLRLTGLGLAMLFLIAGLTACGANETSGRPGLQPGDDPCVGGKCDGVVSERFIDVFKEPSKLGTGDLTKVAADLVTDQINKLISEVPFYQPRLAKTELYAISERAEDSLTLHSLTDLTAGLTQALGEESYATRINALRKSYLESHATHVWAEARFELPNDPSYGVTFDAFGSSSAKVRFGLAGLGRAIDATIIAPYDATKTKGLAKALVDAPARAVISALGGLPSQLKDFRAMVPGQMIALHSSRGVGGFNINGSTPIYLATIASHATLWARISAAASVAATAELDVQMIRDAGEKLIVDVGLTAHGDAEEKNASYSLAVDGRWGVAALDLQGIDLGPLHVDLGSIARKVITKQLHKRFTPFEAAVKVNARVKTRHSVARYAFDLSADLAPEAKRAAEHALALASHGVLFEAQVLARRADSGVEELLSVDRVARRPSLYVGLALPALGMRFYTQRGKNIGHATVTIGEQTQQLFWNEVGREKGWFATSLNYSVMGLASVRSVRGVPVSADHNLRLRLVEKHGFKTSRDEILDHADPILATFIGEDALARIDVVTRQIERYMSAYKVCHSRGDTMDEGPDDGQAKEDDRQCWIARAKSAKVASWGAEARRIFDDAVAGGALQGGLDPAYDAAADFARKIFDLKLRAQTLPEDADFSGPEGKMRVEARLSAKALARILSGSDAAARFEAALRQTVYELNRRRREKDQHDEQGDIDHKYGKAMRKVVDRFRRAVGAYVTQRNLSRLNVPTRDGRVVNVGDEGLLLLVGKDGKVVEGSHGAEAAVATIAERKAASLVDFFEDLVDEAKPPGVPLIGRLFGGLGTTEHQILTYTLLRLSHPWETELLVNMQFEDAPFIPVPKVSLYGRGQEAKLIDAGRFDLQTLLDD